MRPAGGLPSLSPAAPAFSLLFCPHPPDPLPGGKGEPQSLFRRGLRPLHPRHQTACGTYSACRSGTRRPAGQAARRVPERRGLYVPQAV